jgi:hypothetical protein
MAKKRQNNTVIWVLLGMLLLCFILLGYGFYKYFYAGAGTDKYGDRLDEKENYPLSDTLDNDIKSLYSENENIGKVTVNVEGKIIYICIEYLNPMSTTEARDLAIKSLEPIGETNLTYYDVQYLLTYTKETSEENSNFPMFGAKSSDSNRVVW